MSSCSPPCVSTTFCEGDCPFFEELEMFFSHRSRWPKFAIERDWLLTYKTLADGKLYRADPVISETPEGRPWG